MILTSAWFLLGLVFAAIPVVLYLLFRLRKRNVEWGASYILQQTIRQKKKESRWRQYVILALRTLALALVALAFAQPLLEGIRPFGHAFPRGGTGSLTRVILLDNSQSMSARYANATRYAEAQAVAAMLLQGVSGGDSFVLIPLAGKTGPLEFQPPYDADDVRMRLNGIPLTQEPIDFEQGLERAYRHFLSSVTQHRQLFVLCDFAARDFPEPDSLRPFAQSLREIGVTSYFHALRNPDDANLALTAAGFGTDTLLAGQTYNLYVEVANYGATARSGQTLMLLEDSKILEHVDFDLIPNERKTLRLPVALTTGSHALELRLPEDVYPVDDMAFLAASAETTLRVLIVAPVNDQTKGFESESEFLRRALASAGEGAPFKIETETKSPVTLTRADLERAKVVVLAGAALKGEEITAALKRFVRRGGGLIVGLAPNTDSNLYGPLLAELARTELREPYVDKVDYERYLFLQKMNVPAYLLREFSSTVNADIGKARIYNHYRVRVADTEEAPADVLLRLSNGDPALVQARYGRGRVLLWTSTLGGRWNSLVVRQAFLPLMCRMLDEAASGATPPKNIALGEPIIYPRPEGDALYMTTPANQLVELQTVTVDGKGFIRFEQTAAPGLYTVTDKDGEPLQAFSVRSDRVESDLTPVSGEVASQLTDAFDTKLTYVRADLWKLVSTWSYRMNVTTFVILVILGLLVTEALLLRLWFS